MDCMLGKLAHICVHVLQGVGDPGKRPVPVGVVVHNGDGICFNVFCYNVQPNITINYANGDSSFSTTVQSEDTEQSKPTEAIEQTGKTEQANESTTQATEATYILNTNTKKFHLPSCSSVNQMSEKNKQSYSGSRDDLISQGYDPCKRCNP